MSNNLDRPKDIIICQPQQAQLSRIAVALAMAESIGSSDILIDSNAGPARNRGKGRGKGKRRKDWEHGL
jgi:hypothetical protein